MACSVCCMSLILLCVFLPLNCRSSLVQLNEDNWSQILDGDEWMVEFFAPWCPACKSLQPIWEDFATWADDLGISVGQIDVTSNPGLSGRFMVTALPTIFHVKDGQFRQYRGSRDKDELISFIEDKKWSGLDEIPNWKSPNSMQMSLVSYFFKLSMVLRSIHTTFMDVYGLPYWGSYIIFAIATVLVGAFLGIMLVCVIDCIFPPKPIAIDKKQDSSKSETRTTDNAINEEEEDIIEDDRKNSTENKSPRTESTRKRKPVKREE